MTTLVATRWNPAGRPLPGHRAPWIRAVVVAAALGVLLTAGCGGAQHSDPAATGAASPNTAEGQPGGSEPDGSDPAPPGGGSGPADGPAQPPPEVPPEALTGGQEPADLPARWPAEIPLPEGAAILEAAQPPGETANEFHLYMRVAGDLAATVRALAGAFDAAGFDDPRVDLAENTGRLRAEGHGYQIAVDGRVNDDNLAVLDFTYRVTAAG